MPLESGCQVAADPDSTSRGATALRIFPPSARIAALLFLQRSPRPAQPNPFQPGELPVADLPPTDFEA